MPLPGNENRPLRSLKNINKLSVVYIHINNIWLVDEKWYLKMEKNTFDEKTKSQLIVIIVCTMKFIKFAFREKK